MLQPPNSSSEYARGYPQVLNDFGVTQLLSNIRSYSEADFDAARACITQQELESMAVFAILHIGAKLKGSTIARYLNSLRKANYPIVADRPAIELQSNPSAKTPEKFHQESRKVWAIVRILPNAQHYTIAHFFNRKDAEDSLRVLSRFIPGGVFEIVFDRP